VTLKVITAMLTAYTFEVFVSEPEAWF